MFIKKIIQNIFSYFNIGITKINYSAISSFIKKIQVKDCGYQLKRFGEKNDGGYLLPEKILHKIDHIFSAGVGETIKFEEDLKEKFNIESFFIDYSVDLDHIKYNFCKKKINFFNDNENITINKWIEDCQNQKKINLEKSILSIDIESFEIEAFLNLSDEYLKQFAIIVGEFHDFGSIKNNTGLKIHNIIFDKILNYFEICHIHPTNNCGSFKIREFEIPYVMEFTFINKNFIQNAKPYQNSFPHTEDAKSNLEFKDIILPKFFIKKN